MTPDIQLRALARRELEELEKDHRISESLLDEMHRQEAQARALFLLEDRDIGEVQRLLASHQQAWLEFIRSDAPLDVWTGSDCPQSSEYLMSLCEQLSSGLLEAIALNDLTAVAEFRSRLLNREPPELDLSAATMVLARQLCLLSGQEFERATDEIESSWAEWTEFDLVHPRDELWNGVRGIAANDVDLVQSSLLELSRKRFTALRHAVESGLMLRSTMPTRLTLQTDSASLVSLARARGMEFSLGTERLLTQRASLLWGLS